MSQRLQKHREFTAKKEKEFFRLSFLIARKQHVSTQSESELKTSTKRSIRRFDKEFLFDRSTESSNTTIMNLFQQQDESSKAQEFQKESRSQESLKSKSSSSEMILQQQYEFKMMKLKVELMRLEAQKLAFAERDVSFQSTLNEFSASVYQQDKIDIFHKYVAFRASNSSSSLKSKTTTTIDEMKL